MGGSRSETLAQLTVGVGLWALVSFGTGVGPLGHGFSEGTSTYLKTEAGAPTQIVREIGHNWKKDERYVIDLDPHVLEKIQSQTRLIDSLKTNGSGDVRTDYNIEKTEKDLAKTLASYADSILNTVGK